METTVAAARETTPAETYWHGILAGLPRTTALRADRASSPAEPHAIETRASTIAPSLGLRLGALATAQTDVACVLLAAFVTLVARYTGESDVCVGTGDGGSEIVRASAGGDVPFVSLVATLAAERARAATHPLPAARLRALLGDAAYGDVAPTALAFTFGEPAVPSGSAAARQLVAGVTPSGAGFTIRWMFDSGAVEPQTIDRLAIHFENLLGSIVADPSCVLSRLTCTDAAERARELELGRGPVRPYERDAAIADVFRARAAEAPESTAVVSDAGRLTYGELDLRSDALARVLIEHGVEAGATVGIALERSAAMPVALLAVLKAGAAYVPLDPAYPRERLAFMLRDANVVAIVADGDARLRVSEFGVPTIAPDAAARASDARLIVRATSADALAYVTYTSGSTGRPKGVAVTQRGVVRLVRNTTYVDVGPNDTFLQFAPLAFDASTLEIWAPLLNGGTLAIAPAKTLGVDELGEAVARFGVTAMWLTTALFRRAVDAPPPQFEGLRLLLTGGDVAPPQHVRAFLRRYPACRLINGYGPTENTTFSTTHEIAALDPAATSVPIGLPIANSTAYVLDEHGELAPFGVPGELYVGGDGVARGYVGLDDETARRFVPDPFCGNDAGRLYRTGDRVRRRSGGAIEFLGRTDDQVKVRGYRIELEEIESSLRAHPGLRDAAIVIGDSAGEKTLVAYVVPFAPNAIAESDLRTYLAARLPSYLLPHRFAFVAELPSHASGKVDRVALTAAANVAHVFAATPARTRPGGRGNALQRRIGDLWCDVLRKPEPIGLDENFFDAGGDSVLLLVLRNRLDTSLGIALGVAELFEHTTIRAIAAYVERTDPAVAASLARS